MDTTSIVQQLRTRVTESPVTKNFIGEAFTCCKPASLHVVTNCEVLLGRRLPPVLRDIYLNVANGGFGPGYGVMGVKGGFTDDQGETVESLYTLFREPYSEDPEWHWSESWLPFCHWGCGIYSVVECIAPYPVFFIDPTVKQSDAPMSSIVVPHKPEIEAWLQDWLDGKDLWREVWG